MHRHLLGLVVAHIAAAVATTASGGNQPLEITGVVQEVIEDNFVQSSFNRHYLLVDESTGAAWFIQPHHAALAGLPAGTRVQALGRVNGDRTLAIDTLTVLPLDDAAQGDIPAARRVAVILVNLADAVLAPKCSRTQVASELYASEVSVDAFYREVSHGQVSFSPGPDPTSRVFGPFTIGDRSSDGDTFADLLRWSQHARLQAAAAGVPLGGYEHLLWVFPRDACSTAYGEVGCGSDCEVWACALPNSASIAPLCLGQGVLAHEFGHNLGMSHASVDIDNDGRVDPSGEYGDQSDVMGAGGFCGTQPPYYDLMLPPNAPHVQELHWLDGYEGSRLRVSPTPTAVTYTIAALELDPESATAPQILEIGDRYIISTRTAAGFGSRLDQCFSPGGPTRPQNFVGRASIHRVAEGNTLLVATLDDGDAFVDQAGTRIALLGHGDPEALLEVSGPADPPPGVWLTSPALPGYRVKVRIGTSPPREGTKVAQCIASTLCVAGAIPTQPEVFVRVVGPKPNGYLWPVVVRFTTSQVEVWIQRIASEETRYYLLAGSPANGGELPGLFDPHGFLP